MICGGEPTISKGLLSFVKKIRKLGYLVKLDTNGSNPIVLKDLIDKKLIDYVAMDIKAPKEKYAKTVGISKKRNRAIVKKINESINILKNSGVEFEFRTTVIPVFHKKGTIKARDGKGN